MSSAIVASISLVRFERLPAISPALDWCLDTLASISCRDVIADCASAGTAVSGMGVGAEFGFAGEAEACSPGAVPPPETKARIRSKTSRLNRCITGLQSRIVSTRFRQAK